MSRKGLSMKPRVASAAIAVVIPCEPGGDPSACLQALKALPRAEKSLIKEVWLAWGRHPSRQRNRAVARCRATWVLFLDADSRAQPGLLRGLLEAADEFKAVVAGGPNLPPPDEGPWARLFDPVLSSRAGSGPSRARYAAVGRRRLATEKELILCNLLVRRDVFLQCGGFREDLYPNEENEFFNRLGAAGWRLVYEPTAVVLRPRRGDPWAFVLQAFRYGRGRAQQMRRNFFASDLLNLAPLLLLAALLGTGALAFYDWRVLWFWGLYGAACLLSQDFRPTRALFLGLRHLAYAVGLLCGSLQNFEPRDPRVRLERLRLGGRR